MCDLEYRSQCELKTEICLTLRVGYEEMYGIGMVFPEFEFGLENPDPPT